MLLAVRTSPALSRSFSMGPYFDTAVGSLRVEIFRGRYRGQKLTTLVSRNTTARTPSTQPSMPLRVPVRRRMTMTKAAMMRMARSVVPMFFFMEVSVLLDKGW
jgi:hypothetical protein